MKMRTTTTSTWFVLTVAAIAIIAGACGKEPAKSSGMSEEDSLAQAFAADSAQIALALRGKDAYLASCAMCHGPYGEGNGPMSSQIETQGKAPAALNDPILIDALGRDQMIKIITEGGTSSHLSNLMPSWGTQLPAETIAQIADYVMVLPRLKPGISRAAVEEYLATPAGAAADGRKLFVFYCTVCHGPEGRGDGILADTLMAKHQVRPRNLTETAYFAPKTDQEIYMTVALGGDHTAHSELMPGWSVKLSPDEVKDLVSYVRAISKTESKP